MVAWGPILAAAGYGAQSYGSSEKSSALDSAMAAYQQQLRVLNGGDDAANNQVTGQLKGVAGHYNQDLDSLISGMQPGDRIGAFNQGEAQSRGGLAQALGRVQGENPYGLQGVGGLEANPAFNASVAKEQERINGRTGDLAAATAVTGGLNGMGDRDLRIAHAFGDSARTQSNQIQDIMRLYQFGQALRDKARARAAGMNGLDTATAMGQGNTAILLGQLLMGAGQLAGMQRGQQQGGGPPPGGEGTSYSQGTSGGTIASPGGGTTGGNGNMVPGGLGGQSYSRGAQ